MSKLEIKDVIGMIKLMQVNFIRDFRDVNEAGLEILIKKWYSSLSKYPKDLVLEEFNELLDTMHFAPTIGDLITRLNRVYAIDGKTAEQLWDDLDNAVYKINQIIYYAEHPIYNGSGRVEQKSAVEQIKDVYNSLDAVIKEYIPNASGLVKLAQMDTLEYEKNRFLRYVPELRQTSKLRQKYGTNSIELNRTKIDLIGDKSNDD